MNPSRSSKCRQRISGYALLAICGLLLAVALTACSSANTHVNKGHVSANTFSFMNTGAQPAPSYAEDRKEAHALIQQAIIKNLAARGINNVASGGDVTVAYLVVIGNNVATTSLNSYFGYGEDTEALVDKVHEQQAVEGNTRNYFESGTLVVDLVNPKTSKLLQRRSIQAPLLRNLAADARAARVQAIVDQVLKDVPVSP